MRPGAKVILGRKPSFDDYIKIEKLIDAIGERITEEEYYANCRIVTTKPINGNYEGEGVPFTLKLISSNPFSDEFEDTPDDILEVFSIRPCAYINLYSWLSGLENHRIVGELALYLARTFEGVIDFEGALLPTDFDRAIKPYINRAIAKDIKDWLDIFEHANWADVSEATRILLIGMPGRILEIPYQTGPDRIWVKHICDIKFMAAWLNHPDFHMIK